VLVKISKFGHEELLLNIIKNNGSYLIRRRYFYGEYKDLDDLLEEGWRGNAIISRRRLRRP